MSGDEEQVPRFLRDVARIVVRGIGGIGRDLRSRIKRRGVDLASTMGLELVSLVSMAIIFPLTSRALGPRAYGEYTVIYLIFGLIGLWAAAGAIASVVQLILQLEYAPSKVRKLARRQVLFLWFPSFILGTVVVAALLGWEFVLPAALALGIDLPLASLASLNLSYLFAVDSVMASARLRMAQIVLRTGLIVVLALTGTISILALVFVNITASAMLFGISILAMRGHRGSESAGDESLTPKTLARYSFYYSTSMSTNSAQNEGEKFVLAATRPATEVGQYAAVYSMVAVTLSPINALVIASARWFMQKDARSSGQYDRAKRLSIVVAAYGGLVAGFIVAGGDEVIAWVVGPEFPEAATIALWLCFLPLLHGLADQPTMGLLGLGRNKERMLMGVATSTASILAYVVLVPSFGWRGAVIGTYLTELGALTVGWLLLARYQKIRDGASRPAFVAS